MNTRELCRALLSPAAARCQRPEPQIRSGRSGAAPRFRPPVSHRNGSFCGTDAAPTDEGASAGMPCARGMRGCGQVPGSTVSGVNPFSRSVMFGGEAQPLSCLGAAASLLTITTGVRDTARYACRIGPDWACPASERDIAMLYHVLGARGGNRRWRRLPPAGPASMTRAGVPHVALHTPGCLRHRQRPTGKLRPGPIRAPRWLLQLRRRRTDSRCSTSCQRSDVGICRGASAGSLVRHRSDFERAAAGRRHRNSLPLACPRDQGAPPHRMRATC